MANTSFVVLRVRSNFLTEIHDGWIPVPVGRLNDVIITHRMATAANTEQYNHHYVNIGAWEIVNKTIRMLKPILYAIT